jgi:hypothetical protein
MSRQVACLVTGAGKPLPGAQETSTWLKACNVKRQGIYEADPARACSGQGSAKAAQTGMPVRQNGPAQDIRR